MALSAFFSKLKSGLSKSAEKLGQNITATFTKRKLDDAALEELEDMLIAADLGTAVAARIIENFRRTRFGKEVTDRKSARRWRRKSPPSCTRRAAAGAGAGRKPFVILMVGVNGAGKTTTIGKLAAALSRGGPDAMLAAGDTFRAAAVEQLQVWGAAPVRRSFPHQPIATPPRWRMTR